MMSKRLSGKPGTSRLVFPAILLALCWAVDAGLPRQGRAAQGGKADQPEILLSYDLRTEPQKQERIKLRPNTEQSVYLYVKNPSPDTMSNLTVKLLKRQPDGTTEAIGQDTIQRLEKGEHKRVVFGKPAPPPAGKDAPPLPEVAGPPYQLQVVVEDAKGKEAARLNLPIDILQAKSYLNVPNPQYDPKENRLTVEVTTKEDFLGPACTVRLEFPPEFNPGVIVSKTDGVLKQTLTRPNQTVKLSARLGFTLAALKTGRVYLAVDGYERAFMFKNSYTEGTVTPIEEGKRARILAPRYAKPDPKLPITIEVDRPLDLPVQVEVGLDAAGTTELGTLLLLRGSREQHVRHHAAGPDGGLILKSELRDWTPTLDTSEVFGATQLNVRLYELIPDKKGDRKGKEISLTDERAEDPKAPLFDDPGKGPFAPLSYAQNETAVLAKMVLDATPPLDVTLVKLPKNKQLTRGQPLHLYATGREDVSEVTKVTFYLGKPDEGGKFPPNTLKVEGTRKGEEWWAKMPVPSDKKDLLDVSVQFVNSVGLAATDTATLELLEPGGPGDAKKPTVLAKISGVVKQGRFAMPKIEVTLIDAEKKDAKDPKDKVKGKTTTNDKGEFVFEKVPPGPYIIEAVRTYQDRTVGSVNVTVPEGQEEVKGILVKLFRPGK